MDLIGKLAESDIILAMSLAANIFLFKLLQGEKDKRLEDYKEMQKNYLTSIQEFKAAMTAVLEYLVKGRV